MITLDDVCVAIVDCEHKTAPKAADGHPSIRTTDIKNGRIDFGTANRVSEDTYRRWTKRRQPMPGDLILAREAPVGEVGLIPEGVFPVLGQRTVLLSPDRDRVVPRYLHYLLLSRGLQHEIEIRSAGSTVHHLNMKDIRELRLPQLPDLSVQQEIAATLGALDDKIEVNRRMAATLEEMARALYRSWFVDFDPVHAKAQGRAPAHVDPATAALFPARFGDDGLPEGWARVPLLELIEIIGGGTPKTKIEEYWGGRIPWYSVVDAPVGGDIFVHDTEKTITEKGLENSAARLVPMGATILSARGTVGKLAMAGREMAFNQSCYAIRARQPRRDAFVFFTLQNAVERLKSMAHGSVFSTITRNTFQGLEVAYPSNASLQAFEDASSSLLMRMHSLGLENRTLAALRDALLPKLMSGELRVREAEVQVKEAV